MSGICLDVISYFMLFLPPVPAIYPRLISVVDWIIAKPRTNVIASTKGKLSCQKPPKTISIFYESFLSSTQFYISHIGFYPYALSRRKAVLELSKWRRNESDEKKSLKSILLSTERRLILTHRVIAEYIFIAREQKKPFYGEDIRVKSLLLSTIVARRTVIRSLSPFFTGSRAFLPSTPAHKLIMRWMSRK